MSDSVSESILHERQIKFFSFLKRKSDWLVYVLLAFVVFIAVWVRTRNLPGLRDVTTGGWTLGPDLDPFLFLRYAKYIVEHGSLFAIDTMRYVPDGFKTGLEYPLTSYSIAWFHKVAVFFGSVSVEQSAVYYPVFMFALTVIAFFFLTREVFLPIMGHKKASSIAVVACFFLSVISSFLPRTIAGIPEKESAAFFYMFLSFYFFLVGWRQNLKIKNYIYSAIGGLFAGLMALTWGGYGYILLITGISMLVLFLFEQIEKKRLISYGLFIFMLYAIGFIFLPERFTFKVLFTSVEGFATCTIFAILFVDLVLHKYFSKYIFKKLRPYPRIASIIYGGILFALGGVLFLGPSFILRQVTIAYSLLGQSANSRLIQTVAENKQPFFVEWSSNFGPFIFSMPILLILGIIGSILLIYNMLLHTALYSRERNLLMVAWSLFISAAILTRYSPTSIFQGTGLLSKATYLIGFLFLIISFIFVKNKLVKRNEKNYFNNFFASLVFIQIFFAIGLLSARTFIRLVLMLVPPISMLVAYILIVCGWQLYTTQKYKEKIILKTALSLLVIIGVIFAGYSYLEESANLAKNYVPSVYTQQWQKAMSWVRENTPENSVFGHWWDYGYWIQSIGERATVLDGGNLLGYWNHLMGRYALTESNFNKTLEFLYAHNTTHFLIDSTDIGKYNAFSTIGSDFSYDRRSWIPSFVKDSSQKQQRKNSTLDIYVSGALIDEDIIYNQNGTEIFLPSGKAAIGAILIESQKDGTILELNGYFVNGDKTYILPLKNYYNSVGQKKEFNQGINAGVFVYPRIEIQSNGQANIDREGVLLYLSPRTINTNLVNYYLLNKKNPHFILEHVESNMIIEALRMKNMEIGEFAYLNEFRGPIKIWELNYPKTIQFDKKYLQTDYPSELLYS